MQEESPLRILNISDILPNRFQPRIKFDDEKLVQLAKSIDRFGVIEPIVVRPIGSKYEVIAGERRFKASKLVSKSTIPAIVLNLTDKESEEIALLENVQRQSLSPIEEAAQYKRILDNGYISREELAKKLGRSESSILNKIRLLTLSDEVQSYLLNNKISERHARSLLKIRNIDVQEKFLHRIVNERLTVKATDREIREYLKVSEGDTELLFDDERGIDKMDIDKIMREAKDINEPSEEVKPTVDLMANTNSVVQSEESSNDLTNSTNQDKSADENIPVITTEPNKFVNTNIDTSIIEAENVDSNNNINNSNSDVTFDSMFSSPMNNLLQPEPATNSDIQSLVNTDNNGLNSDINGLGIKNDAISNDLNYSSEESIVNADNNDLLSDNINAKPNLLNNSEILNDSNISVNEEPHVMTDNNDLPVGNVINNESNLLNNFDISTEGNTSVNEEPQVMLDNNDLPVGKVINDESNLLNNFDIPAEGNTPVNEESQVMTTNNDLPVGNVINDESNLLNNFDIPTEGNTSINEEPQVVTVGNDLPVGNMLSDEYNLLNSDDILTKGNLSVNEEPHVMTDNNDLPVGNMINNESNLLTNFDIPTEGNTNDLNSITNDLNVTDSDNTSGESNLPNISQINEVGTINSEVGNSNDLSSTSINTNVKKDISVIVADAFKKYSDMPEIPLNNKQNEVLVSDVNNDEKSENASEDLVNNSISDFGEVKSEINNESEHNKEVVDNKDSHRFANIVKMLRDCANSIENSGYMINVDEMDLDNEYKVIFTIKKD